MRRRETEIGPEVMRWYERMIMLQIIDQQWKDHLLALDHLKEGIRPAGIMASGTPWSSNKRESFELFEDLWNRSTEEMVRMLYLLRPISEEDETGTARRPRPAAATGVLLRSGIGAAAPTLQARRPRPHGRAKRRRGEDRGSDHAQSGPQPALSPAGSGKKYKKCCGR